MAHYALTTSLNSISYQHQSAGLTNDFSFLCMHTRIGRWGKLIKGGNSVYASLDELGYTFLYLSL